MSATKGDKLLPQILAPALVPAACLILILCSSGIAVCAMSNEVRSMCEQAEQLINAQRFSDAISLLQRAGSIDPNCPEVHGYLGQAYQNSGKPRQAIDEYNRALQLNPQMTFLNVNLGTCYMNLDQPDQAVPYLQQYLQQNPNAPEAAQIQAYIQQAGSRKGQQNLHGVMDQGQAFLRQHRYPEAIAAFQQAVAAQPDWPPGHFFLGYAMAQSGNHQGAITQLKAALQLDPTMKEAELDIGSSYQSLNDPSSAIAWYQRYLAENPSSPKAGDIRKRINGLREQANKQGRSITPVSTDTSPAPASNAYASAQQIQPAASAPPWRAAPSAPAAPAGAAAGSSVVAPLPAIPSGSDPYEGMLPQQPSAQMPQTSAATRAATAMAVPGSSPATSTQADNYLEEATSDGKYFRWPADKMPLRVFIGSGSGDPSFRPSFSRVLNEALNAWAQASNNTIAFWTVSDPSQADIVCDWTNTASAAEDSRKSDEGGITKLSGQEQSNGTDVKIMRARVTLFTRGTGGATISDDDMKKVCLHEIGHALGLNGHSANNRDVMFYSESTSVWPSLTKRDKATICRLYSGYPKIIGAQER